MLILLPASETKTTVGGGRRFDAAALSFPSLAPTRSAVLDALIAVSAEPDATKRLGTPAGMAEVVQRNVSLRGAPTEPAGEIYSGALHHALGFAALDAASRRRARSWIVVVSALWGAVHLGDRIPPYRLNMCGRLPGLAHLPDVWRGPLSEVLPQAAGRGLIVDGRSAEYATAWRPTGTLAERTVTLRVVREAGGSGSASHAAKRTRGLVVRRIITDAVDPAQPADLAEGLSAHFDVDLRRPGRPSRVWELSVVEAR